MQDQHPLSPEDRRKRLAAETAAYGPQVAQKLECPPTPWEITKRIAIGVYNDGFIHAGNLAFLSILALFPFFILATAIAQLLGQSADGAKTVAAVLAKLPPQVATVLSGPIEEVLTVRTGSLLWLGAVVGLWTAASYIETIRDILRRAYGVKFSAPFWTYRLLSIALILAAVLLLMAAFGATVILSSVQHVVVERVPGSSGLATTLGLYRIAPAIALFVTFYFTLLALTPSRYRKLTCRKWPGALLITLWWLATAELLPVALGLLGGYEITYGSLAGVAIVLIFFFVIGLGVVTGAELNAALADPGAYALKGEIYTGPFVAALEVDEPEPDEDIVSQIVGAGEIEGVGT
jgi:membrane protein